MNFQTPDYICEYMVGILPQGNKTILEPTPGEGNLVKALKEKSFNVIAPEDFWEISGRFDAIVMNPPFSPMETGYKILYKCMEMSDTVIALMPWLTIINSEKRIKKIMDFGLVSITHLPRSVFKGSRVQTCILTMLKHYGGQTSFYNYER
jgi:hypothetical protein